MRINIVKVANNNKLITKEIADKLVNELSLLDWLKLKNITVSFEGVELVNLEFLIPFMQFLHNIDMQDVEDNIKVTLAETTDLHNTLIVEAYKTVIENERRR